MATMQSLLPNATVCVEDSEVETYAKYVDREKLWPHPPLGGLNQIISWMMENCKADCMIYCDDDLQGLRPTLTRPALVTDPDVIRDVIENQVVCCHDLQLGVFCWIRSQNKLLLEPEYFPYRLVMPIQGCWGVMNTARRRLFDPGMNGRGDVDFTLETLVRDRVILTDCRWYWDFGRVSAGKGGNAGMLTTDELDTAQRDIETKWGNAVSFGTTDSGVSGRRTMPRCSIKVSRRNEAVKDR